MTFIVYDTETTGLEPAFDQILQFAAVVADDDFKIIDRINLRCRLQPHVLPSPGAMLVTGVGPRAIMDAPLSCYNMIAEIRAFMEKWSPAVMMGFNSIGYDENMIRQAFYQHLHPVYLTNTNGNTRMDVLVLAHAVAQWRPEAITVPLNDKGRPTFRLGLLMQANGLPMGDAHDALADTQATLDLAAFLRDRAPDVWQDIYSARSKTLVTERLGREKVFLVTDRAFKKSTIAAGVICRSPDNPAAHAVFDLDYDPALYLDVDAERAAILLKSSPRPIRILRANNLPVIRSWQAAPGVAVDRATAEKRLQAIREHPTFASVIAKAIAGQYDDLEPSPHIEEHIYGGFPSPADSRTMARFHAVPWRERYELCQHFQDDKYRVFGERLIFAEQPESLPERVRDEMDRWCRERHLREDECDWMTRAKAIAEIEKLKAEGASHPLLGEIEAFFAQGQEG